MQKRIPILALTLALPLGACTTKTDLPRAQAAYALIPPPAPNGSIVAYTIGPLDTIAVTVFQEPDISVKDLQVDAAGRVILPLIGEVQAAGKTSTELGEHIASLLKTRYLEHPEVSVIVQDSVSQKVTVEGSVTEAGVYEIKGRTTLLDALAMAKGTTRVAALSDVVVFRTINGQRMGALFDIGRINRGLDPDPEIQGNDTVVVGLSGLKAAWRDVLTAAPLIGAFRPFG